MSKMLPAAILCDEWSEAFDICRERNRPILARVGDEQGTCYPSGRFRPSKPTNGNGQTFEEYRQMQRNAEDPERFEGLS